MIETKDLTKTFDNFTAVDSLNLKIEKGEFLPSLPQLNILSEVLHFNIADLLDTTSGQDLIYAMRGEARSPEEREGIEKLFSMMSFLKSQQLLRSKLSNGNEQNP